MDWEKAENLRDKAWALMEMDRPKEAIPLFTKALEYDSEDALLLCGLSTAYHCLEDWETSLRYADQAILADPEEEWGHRRRSHALEAMDRKLEALEAAQEAVRLEPENGDCLARLASVLYSSGRLAEAEKTIREALEADPDEVSSHLLLCLIHLDQNQHAEAEAACRKALDLDPQSAPALSCLHIALSLSGREEEAREYAYQALELAPSSKMVKPFLAFQMDHYGFSNVEEMARARNDPVLRARIQQRKALAAEVDALLSRWQHAKAVSQLHQALLQWPDEVSLLALLAYAYEYNGQFPLALQSADRAIQVHPQDWRGYRWRAWILYRMSAAPGPYREAMQQDARTAILEAERLAPENADCLRTRCILEREWGHYAEAEQAGNRLRKAAPDWACSYQALGQVYSSQGQWRLAEMYYRQSFELSPEWAEAANDVGMALSNQNRKKEALEFFNRAVELAPINLIYRKNVWLHTARRFFGL